MEQIYKDETSLVEYDPENQILYIIFRGMVNLTNTMNVFDGILNFSREHVIQGIVTDIRELKGTFTKLNEYISQEGLPFLIQQGLLCNSITLSDDIFSQFATEDLIKKMDDFEMRTFNNHEEAIEWTKSKVNPEN